MAWGGLLGGGCCLPVPEWGESRGALSGACPGGGEGRRVGAGGPWVGLARWGRVALDLCPAGMAFSIFGRLGQETAGKGGVSVARAECAKQLLLSLRAVAGWAAWVWWP